MLFQALPKLTPSGWDGRSALVTSLLYERNPLRNIKQPSLKPHLPWFDIAEHVILHPF